MKMCRCLLGETDDKEFFRQVMSYLEDIPKEQKAEDNTYKVRLASCKECEKLQNGFCALCGCIVELRAAKQIMSCPDIPKRW